MMKAYKHILFLLFFGLLTLQQVHADNVGKFTLQKVANLSDDASALTGYSKLGTIEDVYVTENNLSKLKTVEIYKNPDGVLAWRTLVQGVDDVLLASLKTKFAGKTKVLNWLDEVTDNAILTKLDDLPTSSITKMEDDILALKSHFNSNPNSISSWNRLVDAPNSIRKNVDLLDNVADWPTSWNLNTVGNTVEVIQNSGRKIATITDGRIIAPARTLTGTPGNPLLNRVPLVKNIIYEVDGIEYITDNLGRVTKTTADLDDIVRVRLGNQQIRAVDIKDGANGVDQGGHIVASRFFGPGEQINLYPQSANLNQGAWKQMENNWAAEMVAGKDVKIEVKAIFSGSSQRPDAFEVSYWIDNVKSTEFFDNL